MLETGHEHAHETYAGEVGDGTYAPFELIQRDTELIPSDGTVFTIAERRLGIALVYDEVMPYDQVFGAYRNAVLIIFFVLVEGVILINVLYIGRGLVRCIVAFAAGIGVG